MNIKILKATLPSYWYADMVGEEVTVDYNILDRDFPFTSSYSSRYFANSDVVITELPKSFCVKKSDDVEKWRKYINWLNETYTITMFASQDGYYGYTEFGRVFNSVNPKGTEIHIDDMIQHIEYMESQQHIKGGEQFSKESQLTIKEEFDLTTNEGRLAYAHKHYPIGTKYIPLDSYGKSYNDKNGIINYKIIPQNYGNLDGGIGFIYANGKWAEIIKKENNMETQKLSRQGLKEIHSVACSSWKERLEQFGRRNPK